MKLLIDARRIDPHAIQPGEVYVQEDGVEIIINQAYFVKRVTWDDTWLYEYRPLGEQENTVELLSEFEAEGHGLTYRVLAIIPDDQEEYDRIYKHEKDLEPNVLGLLWEPEDLTEEPKQRQEQNEMLRLYAKVKRDCKWIEPDPINGFICHQSDEPGLPCTCWLCEQYERDPKLVAEAMEARREMANELKDRQG